MKMSRGIGVNWVFEGSGMKVRSMLRERGGGGGARTGVGWEAEQNKEWRNEGKNGEILRSG